jgi:hypothetical protein
MAAVLRASGPDFDVDAFVAGCGWQVERVFRRGEARLPRTQPDGRTLGESGFNVVVSHAGLDDLSGQLTDAAAFLAANASEVRRLAGFPGVTGVVIDFGVACRDAAVQSYHFPAELVRLAGACGIALELSRYPVSDGDHADAG